MFPLKDTESLETILEYKFKNKDLLIEALSHPSLKQHSTNKKNKDYERLEFLGDAILNFVISKILFENFANYNEGNLAKTRSYLVCKETICLVANKLNLSHYIIMTHGEESSGGRENQNNIENTMEALIAAIYLDSNIAIVSVIVQRLWANFITTKNFTNYDPKTTLQEWAQHNHNHIPSYKVIKREGSAHLSTFTVLVQTKDYEQIGTGSSIKEAEKNAARELLHQLNLL